MTERNDLESLAIALANAKKLEAEAKEARIKAEEELAAAVGGSDIGSTTVKAGCLGVTVKRGYTYKIDAPIAFANQFPDFVRKTEKIEVFAKAYEEERQKDSDLFAMMSEHITATPRKVAIELKI